MSSLQSQTVSGVAWASVQRFGSMAVTFAANVILARLLSPTESASQTTAIQETCLRGNLLILRFTWTCGAGCRQGVWSLEPGDHADFHQRLENTPLMDCQFMETHSRLFNEIIQGTV